MCYYCLAVNLITKTNACVISSVYFVNCCLHYTVYTGNSQ
nr:MAG TPA: hypothetical protein [Caudoviricetes sp.]